MIKKKGERIRHKFSGYKDPVVLYFISFFFFSGFNFDLLD